MTTKTKYTQHNKRKNARSKNTKKATSSAPSGFQFTADTKVTIKTEDAIIFAQDQVSLDFFIAVYQMVFKVDAPKVIDLGDWDGKNCEQPNGDLIPVPLGYMHTRLEFPRLPEAQETVTIMDLQRQIGVMNLTLADVCKKMDIGCIFHNFELGTYLGK